MSEKIKNLLPDLSEDEYQSLEQDIQKNGVKYPIIKTKDGRIVDGYNRVKICKNLSITPQEKIIEYQNEREAIKDSYKLNNIRRIISTNQKIEIAKQLNKDGYTQTEIAEMLGVKQRTVSSWLPKNTTISKNANSCISSKSESYNKKEPEKSNNIPKQSSKGYYDYRQKLSKQEKQDIWQSYKDGKTQQKIASNFKITQQQINKIINKFKKDEEKQKEREQLLKSLKDSEFNPQRKKGRFQDVCKDFANESIDHIITDPPYPKEYLNEWSDLSKVASRILKPSGFCICYSGALHLPGVIQRMTKHLIYYWQLILLHKSPPAGVNAVKINTKYKPILIFQKPPHKTQEEFLQSDLIQGTGSEKFGHEWQQGEEELTQIIKDFTSEGDLILDPFAGSGTTGIACKENKRRSILIDKSKIK